MNVKIVGRGVWGKALLSVVSQNCKTVSTLDRGEESNDHEVLILALPTEAIREALTRLPFSKENKIIVNTTKGIETSTHFLPYKIVQELYGETIEYYSLVGPSFAQEVVDKMPTMVNLGYVRESKNNEKIKSLFQTNYFQVRLTNGVAALELSAAFKNIYAIVCGLADGLGYGTNTRVKLLVLAIEEMYNLHRALRCSIDVNSTVGTTGDLILTCNSTESRNFTFGKLLAQYSTDEALRQIGSTVEGVNSLSSVEHFSQLAQIELPLASLVGQIVKLNNPQEVKKVFDEFIHVG
ncbi:MAG TPA: NAD(P)H-dependent glycerol-3-phosphate dehydrogenase [Patescibacteria group bacterium]|nr:NAD(P)H-dependent glycerol-3-phosphate dehydrogenase [Patescibacteria group bacterium]